MKKRKTINLNQFVDKLNRILALPEMSDSDREIVCAIMETFLEDSGHDISFSGEGWKRQYKIL